MTKFNHKVKLRLFQFIVWTLSLAGLAIQSYYITEQYARYDTVTTVSYGRPSNYTSPKMIVCFPKLARKMSMSNVSSFSPNIVNPGSIFDRYDIRTRLGDLRAIKHRVMFEVFIKRDDLCYSAVAKDTDQVKKLDMLNGDPTLFGILFEKRTINCLHSAPSEDPVMFYLHSNQTFYEDRFSFVRLMMTEDGADVTYSRIDEIRKPPPFETNCTRYDQKYGFESQAHCFAICMEQSPLYRYQQLKATFIRPDEIKKYDLKDTSWLDKEVQCQDQCKSPDCVKHYFIPTLMATSARHGDVLNQAVNSTTNLTLSFDDRRNVFPLALLAPPGSDMTYEAKPKISLIDYLTYISSCANFWLGFSPLVFLLTNGQLRNLFGLAE